MDTRQTLLVDAFAAEPTGGTPVAVVPDGTDVADDQLRAIARELDAPATPLPTDGPPTDLRAVGPRGPVDVSPAVVVGSLGLATERGWAPEGADLSITDLPQVSVESVGRVWVGIDEPDPQPVDVDPGSIAEALGIDGAALRDVGADLPPVRVSAGIEALAAPVNFLEHLGTAAPDSGALADLTEAAGVAAVCAFTFDTLTADATCHARTFVPGGKTRGKTSPTGPSRWVRTVDGEVPVTPAVAGGVATHLTREGTIEDDQPVVEQGHYLDRPGRIHVDPGSEIRVGGRAVVSLDGTLTVPPSEDEDIVEV